MRHTACDSHQHTLEGMLQTLGKKEIKRNRTGGGQKQKEKPRGRRCGWAWGPRSSRQQQVHAPHTSRDTGRTLWKFKIPDGSLGFFFFFLSHFQGNKTRCHLPVAIAISPDSASAAQRKRKPGEPSSLLPRSRELGRVQSSWGEQEINGALSEEAMG